MGTVDARLADVEGYDLVVSLALVKTHLERIDFAIEDGHLGG